MVFRRTVVVLAGIAALLPQDSTAAPAAPALISPPDGVRVGGYNPTLSWTVPGGTTQVQLRVIPYNNDGAGINVVRDVMESFMIPALPGCACLLPDMSYTWEVRVSDAPTAVPLDDPSWSPVATRRFSTPLALSATMQAVEPTVGAVVVTATPTVRWDDSDSSVFYYEVQLSKDPDFGEKGPIAPVYWNLIHGLVSSPIRSYTVPASAPLEVNNTYYWRVRPRVQGDGTPVLWSSTWSFQYRVECCTVTAWIDRNFSGQEHQSYRAVCKLTDGTGKGLAGAVMEAVWTQQGQRTSCFGGFSDVLGVASCIPPQSPVPEFIASVPVQVEVKFTHLGGTYRSTASFVPAQSWRPRL